jgi:hypothetical protein
MTDKIDPRQRINDAIKELHGEWRKTDPVGGLDEFFDAALTPCIDAACKKLGS